MSSVAVQKAIGVGHDPQISKENPGKMILFVLSFLFYFICYEKYFEKYQLRIEYFYLKKQLFRVKNRHYNSDRQALVGFLLRFPFCFSENPL